MLKHVEYTAHLLCLANVIGKKGVVNGLERTDVRRNSVQVPPPRCAATLGGSRCEGGVYGS
jgi:hypothetical protein